MTHPLMDASLSESEQLGCLCFGRNYDDLMDYYETEQAELNLVFWLQNADTHVLFEVFLILVKRSLYLV